MILNKKGAIGTQWALGIAFIFSLITLVFIFNMVFGFHLHPLISDLLPDTQAGIEAQEGIDSYLNYWKFIPILILGNVLIYMLILTFRREAIERYIE